MSQQPGRQSTVRRAALVASLLAVGAFAAAALAAGPPTPGAVAARATVVVTTPTGGPGLYALTVVVRATTATRNRVRLTIGGLHRLAVTDRSHPRARIHVRLRLDAGTLVVRAVGRHARPRLHVRLHLLRAAGPPPRRHRRPPATPASTTTSTTTTVTPTTTTSTTTPSTTTTAAPPAPRPQPPGPGSPYTRLAWSDDFVADWARAGGRGAAQEPVPHTWKFDNWGTCGTSPPQLSQNTGASNSAYLTSSGLVLPVVATGPSSYRTAQLDTKGIAGESWLFGTIEASIQMPTGKGLCPAFWMLPNSGTGEIDIVEAPTFVSATFGPLAPYAIFTLHVGNTQQFQRPVTPPGWNPGQPNVFGIFWTRSSITWTVNYVPYATATPQTLANPALWSALTSGAYHLLLDVAVGGWPGDPPPGTTYSKPMTVQWVKVFQ